MNQRATIRFEPAGRTVTVPVGSTLLEAARSAGLEIDAPCGGTGRCGSCRVSAAGALLPLSSDERDLLGGAGIAAGKRLACRARVVGDAVVTLNEPQLETRVVTSAQVPALHVEPPSERGIDMPGTVLGAAIDIGTTTLAVQLLDLRTGETLAVAGDLNPQRAFGADVLSRVAHAAAGGGPELQRLIAGQVETMLAAVLDEAGLAADRLVDAVVVGNTAMTGLFLGTDVSMLGEAPYAGAPVAEVRMPAPDVGLPEFPALDVSVLPGASAFIGADITAGVLATRLAERATPTLLIDLGTNGELVLAAHGELIAASTAAGPALEGASIACGMRAGVGAIERVQIADGDLEFGVIGDREPVGICGSGLLDLVARLLDAGVLGASGAFVTSVPGLVGARLTERGDVRALMLDPTGAVFLTQKDVRQVQLAVAAVRAGIDLLLAEADLEPADVVMAVVAGGFGYHVSAQSLARLGLVPALWHDRVAFGGNTALAGARMALVNGAERTAAREVSGRIRTVDLAAHPEFQTRFLAALTFPG